MSEILVGEVWVASGQSNMAWLVRNSDSGEETIAAAGRGEYPMVKLFNVPPRGEDAPSDEVAAVWTSATEEAVASFSAVGFYFGAQLARDRSCPVGIIRSAVGGTNANSWINTETYEKEEVGAVSREHWARTVAAYPQAFERWEKQVANWEAQRAAAREAEEPFTERRPREPLGPTHMKRPSALYNGMIAPLQPYAIRGAIWYQGEGNSREPFYPQYRDLMLALVEDWRSDWTEASGGAIERYDFPFYIVQLPNFAGGDPVGWPMIREQMLRFWQEGENTGTVVAIDKGDANDIHPRKKKPIGERLARFARGMAYGESIVYSGPIFKDLQIEGPTAVVRFDHVGDGLAASDEKPLRHFEIAGADGEFVSAVAEIQGDVLRVSAEAVAEPRAVRYAWSNNPEGINFYNANGLPASPFRTDSW
ncbi:MAG: sialate O-acetylesterase [Verrucomicrobiota bacterium]